MISRIARPQRRRLRIQQVVSQHHRRGLASFPASSSSFLIPRPTTNSSFHALFQSNPVLQTSLNHAMYMCRSHDPAGYLPGQLLPTREMQITYYAVRSFWVETGLRFNSTAQLPKTATPEEQLEWWRVGIDGIYENKYYNGDGTGSSAATSTKEAGEAQHPTLRLLQALHHHQNNNIGSSTEASAGGTFTRCHFDDILDGRREDLELKQYPTLAHLERHAMQSCGSLSQLVLESAGIYEKQYPTIHSAAKSVGTCHGLTNALRTSIPVVSTTGRLIIPQDLCEKYDVKTPRYLLSALGQGDKVGIRALRLAVEDIATHARGHLKAARNLREDIMLLDRKNEEAENDVQPQPNKGSAALAVLLPGLASETFLNRLEDHDFDLTDRDLRYVSWLEHARCSARMIQGYYQQTY